MKKTHQKLVLRNETLRVLANMDLSRAAGGLGSGNAPVPSPNLADSGAVACETNAIVVATAVCR